MNPDGTHGPEHVTDTGRELWGALPLGELHTEGVCAYCGAKGELNAELTRTVLAMTQAVAHICVDLIACERRRYRGKRY